MKFLIRGGYLFLYYFIASNLPPSDFPYLGKLSRKIRYLICRHLFSKTGKGCNIQRKAYIGTGSCISMGNYSSIGKNFKCHNTILTIGDYVMMGPDVMIMGGGHIHSSIDIPMVQQGGLGKSRLTIGNDVWIGARATILGNTKTIGTGAIIGAGSVVTKPVPDYAIIAGNPAKIIRYRNQD